MFLQTGNGGDLQNLPFGGSCGADHDRRGVGYREADREPADAAQLRRVLEVRSSQVENRFARTSRCRKRNPGGEARRQARHPADLHRRPVPHNISTGTPLGLEAKKYLDAGDLVPATLTNALVDDRIDHDDAAAGFILDGYPRSVEQAEALKDMLAKRGLKLDAVLEFRVSEDELLERLKGRGRADDTEEVIRNRMAVYNATRPRRCWTTTRTNSRPSTPSAPSTRCSPGRCRHSAGNRSTLDRPIMINVPGLRRKVVPQRSPGELDAMAAAGALVAAALQGRPARPPHPGSPPVNWTGSPNR